MADERPDAVSGRPGGLDLLAGATALLLPVAYLPLVDAPFWSPKVLVLLPAAAVGLTRLPALVRGPARWPAIAALVLGAVATLSTLASEDPVQATFGLYNAGTGLAFVWALVGCWALGASLGAPGRRRVAGGLLAGVGLSALVGVVQLAVDLGVPFLGSPVDDRATGLAGNPVHLAALALGAAALTACSPRGRWWALAVVLAALVVDLSGSRFALLLLPAVAVAAAVVVGVRRGAAVLMALGLGLVVAAGLTSLSGQDTAGTDRVTGLSASSSGITARVETWGTALGAVADRPLLGVGPGRFRAATSPRRTIDLVRAEGPDRVFEDAHALPIEYATTTGLLGAAALLAWLAMALRRARDVPLAAFAVAVLVLHAVQPQSVGTTPVALLALGASASLGGVPPLPRRSAAAAGAAALLALAAGATLAVGDALLQQARLDFDDQASRRAAAVLAPWPSPATVRARLLLFDALDDPGGPAGDEALRWRREAMARAPDDPALWNTLAEDERAAGRVADALVHHRRALDLDPWSRRALRGVVELGDGDEAATARRRLDLLASP